MNARTGTLVPIASGLAVAAIAAFGVWLRPPALPQPRHVILISLDTLRADHLSLYGYQRDTSSRLDLFAQRAFVFEHALAPAPNTPPSQMSLMTSLYPEQHGFFGRGTRLADGHRMLSEILRDAGYQTAGFVDGGFLSRDFGFDRGFDHFEDERGGFARILPAAEKWIRAHRERPFFVFLHTYDIHTPYRPPRGYKGRFHDVPYEGSFDPSSKNMKAVAFQGRKLSDADLDHVVARYDEGIRYTDEMLGGFLDFLESSLLLDDTLVVVTSDHGEEFGEHGGFLHWQIYYQPNLRVPLVVHVPGAARSGIRIEERVESIDVLPTILDLLGLPAHEAAEGRSLAALMRGDREPPWRWLGSGGPDPGPALGWPPNPDGVALRSVVEDRHQLVLGTGRVAPRLYDLDADPMATRDVADERPRVVERLLESWENRRPRVAATKGAPVEIDDTTRERLEELGYLQ